MTTKHVPATALPWDAIKQHSENRPYSMSETQDIEYRCHAANAYPGLVARMRGCLALIHSSGDLSDAPEYQEADALLRELGEA